MRLDITMRHWLVLALLLLLDVAVLGCLFLFATEKMVVR